MSIVGTAVKFFEEIFNLVRATDHTNAKGKAAAAARALLRTVIPLIPQPPPSYCTLDRLKLAMAPGVRNLVILDNNDCS